MSDSINSFNFKVLNLLLADARSNMALLGALRSVRAPINAIGEWSISANDDADQVEEWLADFWNGKIIFPVLEVSSMSEQQRQVMARLYTSKENLCELADGLIEVLAQSSPSDEALRELAASDVKYVGMRRAFLLGLADFAERFNRLRDLEYYRPLLAEAGEAWDGACQLLHQVIGKVGGHLDVGMRSVLMDSAHALPGAFRSYAHEVNLLISNLHGGPDFENTDFTTDEGLLWSEHGYNAVQAGYWRAYGLTPDEASSWTACGIAEPALAQAWKCHGFNPDDVSVWVNHDIAPLASAIWQKKGSSASDAKMFFSQEVPFPLSRTA